MGIRCMQVRSFVAVVVVRIKRYFCYVKVYWVLSTRFCYSRNWKSIKQSGFSNMAKHVLIPFNCWWNKCHR